MRSFVEKCPQNHIFNILNWLYITRGYKMMDPTNSKTDQLLYDSIYTRAMA